MRRLYPIVVVLLSLAVLGGCHEGVLAPVGPVGQSEKVILLDALAIMLAIVIPTITCTLLFAWWFRASNTRAKYRPDWAYSGRLELLVWSIPALVVLFVGGIGWIGSHDLDPAQPLSQKKALEIEAVSLDWKWLFIYPEQGIATVNQLTIPTGVPIHFKITSATVFNAFFIPRLGTQIYAMNGMVTQLNLEADQDGSYPGLSSHFSGDGFSDMNFNVVAEDPSKFEAWVTEARGSGPALSEAAYRGLLKQSSKVAPMTFKTAKPDLFEDIVSQKLPPGDGPSTGQPAPDIKPKQEDPHVG